MKVLILGAGAIGGKPLAEADLCDAPGVMDHDVALLDLPPPRSIKL